MKRTILAAMLLIGFTCAQAQQGGEGPALGSQTTPAKSADALLRVFEGEMLNAAKAMPAEKYSFAPGGLNVPGATFDKVRTFADEVSHVAQANYFFAMSYTTIKPDVDVKAIGKMTSKDELVSALAASFAFLHKANATLTPQNAFEVVSFEGAKAPRMMIADFAVAHGYDHYGQMVEYLRLNGIVPPASAK